MDIDIEVIVGVITALVPIFGLAWKKILKPLLTAIKRYEDTVESIELIKKDVVNNDGESLKSCIKKLTNTCENIEKNQKVLEQRSRSSLHYSPLALFETDRDGQLIWVNEAFCNITNGSFSDVKGYDWISLIRESDREDFLKEFASCINMGRKIDIDTTSSNNIPIRFVGCPLKISNDEHAGFLINVYERDKHETHEN